jgi:hypothetical protein
MKSHTDQELFEQLSSKLPDSAYKKVPLRGGFVSVDAYSAMSKMTSVFGLCGKGWGFGNLQFEHTGDNVICVGEIWYLLDGERHFVKAVGDAQVVKGNVAEAYKKAQTNLFSKASSYLGIGLSVYQGRGLDDPYLDRAEIRTNGTPPEPRIHTYDVSDAEEVVFEWLQDNGIDTEAIEQDGRYREFVRSDKPIKKLERFEVK